MFTQAQIKALSTTTFGADGCSSASVSSAWCPTSRSDGQLAADYVGLYVRVRHPFISEFYGTGMTIDQRSVMRIEPSGS